MSYSLIAQQNNGHAPNPEDHVLQSRKDGIVLLDVNDQDQSIKYFWHY